MGEQAQVQTRHKHIYNRSALLSAFSAYGGTAGTRSMATARHCMFLLLDAEVRDPDKPNECDIPEETYTRVMQTMVRLPQGGRHVHEARQRFVFWLDRATRKEEGETA